MVEDSFGTASRVVLFDCECRAKVHDAGICHGGGFWVGNAAPVVHRVLCQTRHYVTYLSAAVLLVVL